MPFAHYQQQTANKIKRLRRDLDSKHAEWILDANSPFEFEPKSTDCKKGMLMIHGLLDSPFTMRDLGHFYQQQGFLVRGILLDGHGTIPEQLKDVDYHQWIANVNLAVKSLRKVVDEIYITGFSTGGLLALHHCLTDTDIKAIITLCPALKLNTTISLGTKFFILAKNLVEHDYWHIDTEKNDPTKYNQFPINAVHQVTSLGEHFMAINKKTPLTLPLMMIATADDETVQGEACYTFFQAQHNHSNHMLYYTNQTEIEADHQIEIIKTHDEENHILSYSHIAIPFSPKNPHYGIHGDYQQAVHYHDVLDNIIYRGAVSKENLKRYNLQRLSYNPQFNTMCNAIKRFLCF